MILKDAIKHLEQELNDKQDWSCVACKEDHEQLLSWLKELQVIKDADSNDALEKLDSMYHLCTPQHYYFKLDNCYNTIKNYILKAQDKVKAFDLINEKDVDIKLLKWAYPSVEAYNTKVRVEKDYWWRKELTKEEFEFIGRLVGAE